jgi:DHA2 family multidrug resistance protein
LPVRLNELQAGMSASSSEIAWVQTSYLIAEVIAIPLSSYLSRMMSTRIYFVISATGFALASLACAFAWSLPSLLVFRTITRLFGRRDDSNDDGRVVHAVPS